MKYFTFFCAVFEIPYVFYTDDTSYLDWPHFKGARVIRSLQLTLLDCSLHDVRHWHHGLLNTSDSIIIKMSPE